MSRFSSLSVDLDNHWSYLKTHGNQSWRGFPSYLDTVVPLVCEFAGDLAVEMTAFVVGQDAELAKNSDAMARLGESGLEVANHSFHHEPWLHLKTRAEIDEEIGRADRAIEQATGVKAWGFRGPGFSFSRATLGALRDHGYRYDASTLPTFIGPLARAFYMRGSTLDDGAHEQRDKLFGGWRDVLRPVTPYLWDDDIESPLVEIPVTTIPLLRIPFHGTYLLYIAKYSPAMSRLYLRMALGLCRATGVAPSLLLHSLDFIGREDIADLSFFPGMDMSGPQKRELIADYVSILADFGEIVTVGEHAERALDRVPARQPVNSLP
jgi:peptidoglycan-N-acetylglucosamine deacetylase